VDFTHLCIVTNRATAAKYCMRSSHWHLLPQYVFTFDVLVLVLKVLFSTVLSTCTLVLLKSTDASLVSAQFRSHAVQIYKYKLSQILKQAKRRDVDLKKYVIFQYSLHRLQQIRAKW